MICLIRHGETDWNYNGMLQGKTDIPLNATGRQQAEECRVFLEDSEWDVIVTSPLIRARQTAEIINKNLNLSIVEMEEFQERSFGDAEGTTKEERNKRYPDGNYPGMETREFVTARVMNGMEQIIEKFGNKKVLLVAHGAVINSILSSISNGEIGSGKTTLINACISNVQFFEGQWKVHNYNQINHLTKYNH
ncbi:histidine phosphatase family protein [Aquibacillus albus]|uniref:Phosphatase n=1 Tax=Aquibacillus albus TaxID=1168171 RepID=A0ABS2N5K8_9BACI|nr:histidine phosphatase family protein [Aquibacillus albus]MBM7573165.1 putative phosphatase [Aquibacillus albus]